MPHAPTVAFPMKRSNSLCSLFMFVLVLKLKKVSSKIVTTKPVCVVLFKKRPLKKTVYTLSLEPGIWVYFRHYLTSRLRARVVWVAFLLCRTASHKNPAGYAKK